MVRNGQMGNDMRRTAVVEAGTEYRFKLLSNFIEAGTVINDTRGKLVPDCIQVALYSVIKLSAQIRIR